MSITPRVKMKFEAYYCLVIVIISQLALKYVDGTGLKDDASGSLKFFELDKDYRIYQKRLSWSEALDFCAKCVGSFAIFENPAEAEKVGNLIYKLSVFSKAYDTGKEPHEWGLDRRYWFGLTDEKNESNWVWIKKPKDAGTPMTNLKSYKWYRGQPDHLLLKTAEHCGGFWNPVYHLDGQKEGNATGRQEAHSFNDFPCDMKMYFICKNTADADAPSDPSCTAAAPSTGTGSVSNATSIPIVLPSSGTTTPAPSSGTNISAPSSGTSTPAPSSGTITSAPSSETATSTPSSGTTTPAPSSGASTPAPSSETATSTPSSGTTTSAPSSGTTTPVPSSGTNTSSIQCGGTTCPPCSEPEKIPHCPKYTEKSLVKDTCACIFEHVCQEHSDCQGVNRPKNSDDDYCCKSYCGTERYGTCFTVFTPGCGGVMGAIEECSTTDPKTPQCCKTVI